MTCTHNTPSEELLLDYATGTLPHAFDIVVASHVSIDRTARARLDEFEAVGGALFDDIETVPVDYDSFEKTLAKLREPLEPKSVEASSVFPSALREVVEGDEKDVQWRFVGGGVKQSVLYADDSASVRLLLIPAGTAIPEHSHEGTELTLVLKGVYRDGERRFARGDLNIADASIKHAPVAEAGDDCICLIATDAKLRFEGLIPRMAQPFIGI